MCFSFVCCLICAVVVRDWGWLPASDFDYGYDRASKTQVRKALGKLSKALRKLSWAANVEAVHRAKVPIVRLKHVTSKIEVLGFTAV